MPMLFNSLLAQHGIDPATVRLVRHQDQRTDRERTPYNLWRTDRAAFERYQSTQSFANRAKFRDATKWATFVVDPGDETLFAGMYDAQYKGVLDRDIPHESHAGTQRAGSCDEYDLKRDDTFEDLVGRLIIDWGPGARAWVQQPSNHNKPIREIRTEFRDPEFPGYLNFVTKLSELPKLYPTWQASLKAAKGIYVLTCPTTKEQYVGSANGEFGFWQRWEEYRITGHGGNVALRANPSDYQVAILEVAGSPISDAELLAMENRWKIKLQSREMGLNRN